VKNDVAILPFGLFTHNVIAKMILFAKRKITIMLENIA